MGGKCNFADIRVQRICEFLEKARTKVDTDVTRTDFSDPSRPVQRPIGPDGQFLKNQTEKNNRIRTVQEYRQAAIHLAEITTHKMKPNDFRRLSLHNADCESPATIFDALKCADSQIHWLPTDPFINPGPNSSATREITLAYIKKADELWKNTKSIRNVIERKRKFAQLLHDEMSPSKKNSFGINFFDPKKTSFVKKDHPFYSRNLDCFGSWLYGVLCERHGISATPVQRFTNDEGRTIDHVLVGIRLDPKKPDKMGIRRDPKKPDKLTLVSFHPGEIGFDIKFSDKSTWAPISRSELLAHYLLTRAFVLFNDDKEKQYRDLEEAYSYAPHFYAVNYQLGVWHLERWSETEDKAQLDKSKYYFERAYKLNPTHQALKDAMLRISRMD